MPNTQILYDEQDLIWLFDTHLKSMEDLEWAKNAAKAAIIIGNEDFPERIELYGNKPILFRDKPFYIRNGD